MQRLYKLRCVFYYEDGKIWRGMWDKSGTALSDMAAGQPLSGLTKACIESKSLESAQTTEVVACEAKNFRRFQWLAIARSPMIVHGQVTVTGTICGLTIETGNERVTAFVDGTTHIENIEV